MIPGRGPNPSRAKCKHCLRARKSVALCIVRGKVLKGSRWPEIVGEGGEQPRKGEEKGKENTKPANHFYLVVESASLEVGKRPGGLAVDIVSWLRPPVT